MCFNLNKYWCTAGHRHNNNKGGKCGEMLKCGQVNFCLYMAPFPLSTWLIFSSSQTLPHTSPILAAVEFIFIP